MVRDEIYDPDGPYLHIEVLRCLNCGGTVYVNKKVPSIDDQSGQMDKKKIKAA